MIGNQKLGRNPKFSDKSENQSSNLSEVPEYFLRKELPTVYSTLKWQNVMKYSTLLRALANIGIFPGIFLQICQKQKDRKLLAACSIFNKSKSLLWIEKTENTNIWTMLLTKEICLYRKWYKEPGVVCLSVFGRFVGISMEIPESFMDIHFPSQLAPYFMDIPRNIPGNIPRLPRTLRLGQHQRKTIWGWNKCDPSHKTSESSPSCQIWLKLFFIPKVTKKTWMA